MKLEDKEFFLNEKIIPICGTTINSEFNILFSYNFNAFITFISIVTLVTIYFILNTHTVGNFCCATFFINLFFLSICSLASRQDCWLETLENGVKRVVSETSKL